MPTLRKPLLIAHRGESHDAPENTLAAINLAWQRGDLAAEIDVHLTRDGRIIICHDEDTQRTAVRRLVVKEHTAEELRQLDVGSWKDARFAGERLPLLDEVLATIPAGNILFIEVKIGPEAIPELKRCIQRAGKSPEQTIIIAFDANTVREAKKQLPQLKLCWLAEQERDERTGRWTPTVDELIRNAKLAGGGGLDLGANDSIDAAFVKAIHDADLEVYVWTVDDPTRARALAAAGVDGITSNRAAWLREQLK
jgi:glycerophosphoryl diester phosphodiesterase